MAVLLFVQSRIPGPPTSAWITSSIRAPCAILKSITRPVSFACMRWACMHWFVHAHQYYGIGIDSRSEPSQWRFSSVPVAQQSNDDYDDETLLKKLCALLCVLQNASECTLEHIKSQKFLGGACP